MIIEAMLLGGLAVYVFYPKETKKVVKATEDEVRDYLNYRNIKTQPLPQSNPAPQWKDYT